MRNVAIFCATIGGVWKIFLKNLRLSCLGFRASAACAAGVGVAGCGVGVRACVRAFERLIFALQSFGKKLERRLSRVQRRSSFVNLNELKHAETERC